MDEKIDLNKLSKHDDGQKLNFYKLTGNELVFQLIDLEWNEVMRIWDNKDKKFYGFNDTIRQSNGIEVPVKTAFYVPKELFDKAFSDDEGKPYCTKNYGIIRKIRVEGQPQLFQFKKTANESLNNQIKATKTLDRDPLSMFYKLTKQGSGLMTKWNVELSSGIHVDPNTKKLESMPNQKVIIAPANEQELAFIKTFNDGELKAWDPEQGKELEFEAVKNKPSFVMEYVHRGGEEKRASDLWDSNIAK